MDQPKIERLLRLMKLMSGSVDYSIAELSGQLDMSPRTIYRYIDTFKSSGFAVIKLYGDTYKLGKMPKNAVDIDRLIYFSQEEAYLVNSMIERLSPTNALKANLKAKLSAIYRQTNIAECRIADKQDAANVEDLGDAIERHCAAVLKNYESGNSHTIRDRHVEPFAFTPDYMDICAYDLDDGRNKTFKISRIEAVEVLDSAWEHEKEHQVQKTDIFRTSGTDPKKIRLMLSLKAKNLLVEEFPLAEKYLKHSGEEWLLETEVYSYVGACRFYVGLASDIRILDSPRFVQYVNSYLCEAFGLV